ncbi:hypothetical protein MCUN1_003603 [Malassezia cuniculi]|uniref:Uncharacterized protein n=1 Tax=Malassezia cuniculi TaxID=948313 RepID=A0AAF0EYR1_9BASI|nr:hypothetical protein MCUN1_003603 [Malassezia cuniculi]
MSRVGRNGGGQEHEIRKSIGEPVTCWTKEWVIPSALARSADGSEELNDANSLRILKWVRTSNVVTFDEPQDEPMNDAPEPAPEPATQ